MYTKYTGYTGMMLSIGMASYIHKKRYMIYIGYTGMILSIGMASYIHKRKHVYAVIDAWKKSYLPVSLADPMVY